MGMTLSESHAISATTRKYILIFFIAVFVLIPLFAQDYVLVLVSYGLIYSIVALSVNLLLGYGGLVSFGHAAFFTVGAYSVALLSINAGIYSIDLLIISGLVISLLTALVIGMLCVRHTRIYFMILTFALSEVIHAIIHRIFGAAGLPVPVPISRLHESTLLWMTFQGANRLEFLRGVYYYYILAWFALVVFIYWVLVNSPFGKTLQAVRDNEERATNVGVSVRRIRLLAFMVSGAFTGLAGALWAPLTGLVDPHMIHWDISGEYVFYALLGGVNTFVGPIVGAFILTSLKDAVLSITTYWRFLMGAILVLLVLIIPRGVVGEILALVSRPTGDSAALQQTKPLGGLAYIKKLLIGGDLRNGV